MSAMRILSLPSRSRRAPGRLSIALGLGGGLVILCAGLGIGWLIVVTHVLDALLPSGRASFAQLVVGAVGWTVGLALPASLTLLGAWRVAIAVGGLSARRPRATPTLRAAPSFDDEYALAVSVRLPDTARAVGELVLGPFGAAVIEELPAARSLRHHGRSWEARGADGRWRPIDDPLAQAARDAESVRRWFDRDDSDHVVKVFAAVVGDAPLERTSDCAVIRPDQVAAWLKALPGQRMLSADRRERLVELVRRAVED